MKKNELQYKPGHIPFVWVVSKEHGLVSVFFDEKNARECFENQYHIMRQRGAKLIHEDRSETPHFLFEYPNGERAMITLRDKIISDYKY